MSLNNQSQQSKLQEQLRGLLATMLMVAPVEIGSETSLAVLNTSLGSARLRLGLKRLGLTLPQSAKPATFAGLLTLLSGEVETSAVQTTKTTVKAVPKGAPATSGTLQVGLDVEEIRSLPVAVDYWEHDFYRSSFARSEIAYAVLEADPLTHFAGFWCAKEALRKCDPSFAEVPFDRIAIAHETGGRPYLTLASDAGPERLPHAVSISHTTDVATAVVVSGAAAPETVIETIAPILAAEIVPEKRKSRGLAKLFGI
jgi:phosphopantetheine--protein transferase-like protein